MFDAETGTTSRVESTIAGRYPKRRALDGWGVSKGITRNFQLLPRPAQPGDQILISAIGLRWLSEGGIRTVLFEIVNAVP